MTGIVFFETLRRSWRQIIYWGLGLFLWAFLMFFVMQDQNLLEEYGSIVQEMPEALTGALGIGGAGGVNLATPEGFIGYGYFGYMLLVMSVFGVIAGLNVTANEEDQGAMDVLMSAPIQRWCVVVEKLLAYSVMVVGIVMVGFLGLAAGEALGPEHMQMSLTPLLEGSLNLVPGTLVVLTVTAMLGTLMRRRGQATALASLFVIVSYLLDTVGRAATVEWADTVREVSIFAHYDGVSVPVNGADVGSMLLLLGVALVASAASVNFFRSRDLAV